MSSPAWDNKIVNYDPAVPLDSLLFHPQNPKLHPRAQTDALKGILGEVGWLSGVIVNLEGEQHVLDGHDRIKAAAEAGQTTVPVFYVRVPVEMESYVLATFDPVGSLAGTDSAVLADLLREVSSGDSAVQALLAKVAEESGVLADLALPDPTPQQEPQLKGECFIEVYCSAADLEDFRPVLAEWGARKSVTVNIS